MPKEQTATAKTKLAITCFFIFKAPK